MLHNNHSIHHVTGWSSFFIWLGCNVLSGGLYMIDLYVMPLYPDLLKYDSFLSFIIHALMVISLILGIAVATFNLREKYATYKEKKLSNQKNDAKGK